MCSNSAAMAGKRKKGTNGHVHPDDEPKLPVHVRKQQPHEEDPRGHHAPKSNTPRSASVHRRTKDTDVHVDVDLDGSGLCQIETGLPFFDQMLMAFARHSLLDLRVLARGDLDVGGQHTVEDVGLCIGRAIHDAMGDGLGMTRFGDAVIPFDEALVRCAVDYSDRPHLAYKVAVTPGRIGNFDVELAEVFFTAFANEARMNLHLVMEQGTNRHHIIEACFKALARATAKALEIDPRRKVQAAPQGARNVSS